MKTTAIVYGTRPEFLKVFPLIKEFNDCGEKVYVINTGQHDSMLTIMEKSFGIVPDIHLSVQSTSFTNSNLISKIIHELSNVIHEKEIQNIVAQGDTFTVLASSMVAFMEQKRFFHIEAGLRTSNIKLPFPEEYNRRVVSLGADMNFAPTELSYQNLIRENIPESKIKLTGNTIVDMIQYVLKEKSIDITYEDRVFITAHRRENIGGPLINISESIKELALENPNIEFHWALHPNPNTRKLILNVFGSEVPKNMIFTEPLDYVDAIEKMAMSKFLISDSGGIQEEAPSLNKRVLILRDETERPEVLNNNIGVLVGHGKDKIKEYFYNMLNGGFTIDEKIQNPFGEGNASNIIYRELLKF